MHGIEVNVRCIHAEIAIRINSFHLGEVRHHFQCLREEEEGHNRNYHEDFYSGYL